MMDSNSLIIPPEEGLKGFKKFWLNDFIAGLVVFAVAVPMCLAISEASGFPAIAGLIASIVGGIVITFISGSYVAIKGAPAGLSTIATNCMGLMVLHYGMGMNAYKAALAVIVASGVLQAILGLLKAGSLGDFFPAAVVQGMLAALGIKIAIQQFPVAVGVYEKSTDVLFILSKVPTILEKAIPEEELITIVCLAILFIFNAFKKLRFLPIPLLAVVVGIVMAQVLGIKVGEDELKEINDKGTFSLDLFFENPSIYTPDFSSLLKIGSWQYVFLFTIIGSVESLLSAKAVDKMDPYKRKTNLNKDLLAIGIGNIISGMIGGLSMISASKRGAVNINSGGKTRWSNFYQGLFMLLMILFAGKYLTKIPLSCLASILIFSGINLVRPSEFFKVLKIGYIEFTVYFITMFAILITNIMYGVLIGVVAEMVVHLFFGVSFKSLFFPRIEIESFNENSTLVSFKDAATFSNYLYIKKKLNKIPKNHNVVFDFAEAMVVDHSFLEHLAFYEDQLKAQGRQIEVIGMDYHNKLSDHPLSSKRIIKGESLDSRQESLKSYSEERGLSFDERVLSSASNKYEHFFFNKTHKVNFQENTLMGAYKGQEIEITDIMVEQGRGINKKNYKMTIMHIYFNDVYCPDFSLEKEGFIDSLIDLGEYKDIDFDSFPKFSYYYLLKGPDESKIRKFFNPSMLKFFEDNRGNNLENNGKELLIYRRPLLLPEHEVDELLNFGLDFLDILFPDEEDNSKQEDSKETKTKKHTKSFFEELDSDED